MRTLSVKMMNAKYLLLPQAAFAIAMHLRRLGDRRFAIILMNRGVLPFLVGMLLDTRGFAASNAAYALGLMARGCDVTQDGIAAADGVPYIVNLLRNDMHHCRIRALEALYRITMGNANTAGIAFRCGAVPLTLLLLGPAGGAWRCRGRAADVVFAMASASAEARSAFLDGGAERLLADMMFDSGMRICEGRVKDAMTALGKKWGALLPGDAPPPEEEEVVDYSRGELLDRDALRSAFSVGTDLGDVSAPHSTVEVFDTVEAAKRQWKKQQAEAREAANRKLGATADDGFFSGEYDY